MDTMKEVPDRRVEHDIEDANDDRDLGHLVGEAQTLPMSPPLKKKARVRRERIDRMGGFGFQA